jgi:3-methyl-2-oxobutanoate hydroxymethyltransferase
MKITTDWLRGAKVRGEKIPVLTAYDYPTARLLDEAQVPVLLVGDSVGMVVLGFPDTTEVTLEAMEHHVQAVARAKPQALIVADLPISTYEIPEQAVASARRLMASGAEAVKLEGGESRVAVVEAIRAAGIPVMGHLGMLPQRVRVEGGYHIKGKTEDEKRRLLADATALEQAGVFALVLELVVPEVAGEIRRSLKIPTIGIGAGPDCDGQVLVVHDLVGGFPWFKPKFAESRAAVGEEIRRAAKEFCRGVREAG